MSLSRNRNKGKGNGAICNWKYYLQMRGQANYLPEAEFKEFEPLFKFKSRLNHGWFHLK